MQKTQPPGRPPGLSAGSANSWLASFAVNETRYVEIDKNNRVQEMHRFRPTASRVPAALKNHVFETRLHTAVPATGLDHGVKTLLSVTRTA